MKKVLVKILSNSIGDTVASLPYVSKFQSLTNDNVYVSINDWLIPFFSPVYTNILFLGRNVNESFEKQLNLDYNFNKPIQKGYAEQLGFFNAEYIRPKIHFEIKERPIKNKYITLNIHSTSQLKYWNHSDGVKTQPDSPNWNSLCNMLRKDGFTPVAIEPYDFFGAKTFKNGIPKRANKKIGLSLMENMNYIHHSEFFIGLSSGLSWIAHAMGKPVVMISNFTEDWNEFDLNLPDYIRITNKNVCHGCFNKVNKDFDFDIKDWYWCPLHKNTNQQFECHTSISPNFVYEKIKNWLI